MRKTKTRKYKKGPKWFAAHKGQSPKKQKDTETKSKTPKFKVGQYVWVDANTQCESGRIHKIILPKAAYNQPSYILQVAKCDRFVLTSPIDECWLRTEAPGAFDPGCEPKPKYKTGAHVQHVDSPKGAVGYTVLGSKVVDGDFEYTLADWTPNGFSNGRTRQCMEKELVLSVHSCEPKAIPGDKECLKQLLRTVGVDYQCPVIDGWRNDCTPDKPLCNTRCVMNSKRPEPIIQVSKRNSGFKAILANRDLQIGVLKDEVRELKMSLASQREFETQIAVQVKIVEQLKKEREQYFKSLDEMTQSAHDNKNKLARLQAIVDAYIQGRI